MEVIRTIAAVVTVFPLRLLATPVVPSVSQPRVEVVVAVVIATLIMVGSVSIAAVEVMLLGVFVGVSVGVVIDVAAGVVAVVAAIVSCMSDKPTRARV